MFRKQKRHLKSAFSQFIKSGLMVRLLAQAATAETLVEAIDTTTCIQNFLLTGVEWVTGTTYVDVDIFADSGFGFYYISAAASGGNVFILRVNSVFHQTVTSVYFNRAATQVFAEHRT
ncbi:hypothetical protein BGP75_02830 [Motiliproteus sp. MSK22-1]|nr:hypothetical protein BGP75_02830 [Motiliproteus sp. MSK22-1]